MRRRVKMPVPLPASMMFRPAAWAEDGRAAWMCERAAGG